MKNRQNKIICNILDFHEWNISCLLEDKMKFRNKITFKKVRKASFWKSARSSEENIDFMFVYI